jgi:hypothetical protein
MPGEVLTRTSSPAPDIEPVEMPRRLDRLDVRLLDVRLLDVRLSR